MRSIKSRILYSILVLLAAASNGYVRDLYGYPPKVDSIFQSSVGFSISDPAFINWPVFNGIHQTGKVTALFNCFGTFGASYSDVNYRNEWPGITGPVDFSTPPDSAVEYLFGGTIWVGGRIGDDTLVSVGADGWQGNYELSPPNYHAHGSKGTVNKIDIGADFSMRADYSDTVASRGWYSPFDPAGHRPLGIKVACRSHAWHSSPQNNIIIYDIVITNVGSEAIYDGFVGLYFDCDVGADPQGGYYDDLTGSFRNQGIGYIIDNDGDIGGPFLPATRIFAFKFLDQSFFAKDTTYNWWIGNGSPSLDFGPRQRETAEYPFRDFGTGGLGTPEGDANKYYIMSFREWDYDQIYTYSIGNNDSIWLPPNPAFSGTFSSGYDTRFLMAIGTFQLPVDSSIRVLFSTFTGDHVHTTSGSVNYLPHDPATYLSLLYFNDVFANAVRADSLAGLILNPQLPPLGLQLVKKPGDSFEIQWDPWVYGNISGYYLYVSEPNFDLLPRPGAIPPWWMPDTTATPVRLEKTYKLQIDSLDHDKRYLAAIAHRFANTRGQLSAPLDFRMNEMEIPPPVASRHAFGNPGGPVTLKWSPSADKSTVNHYNIYKFPNKLAALNAYHPFYDEGYFSGNTPPVDSFFIGGKTYFYYAMEPYAVAGPNDTVFLDYAVTEGDVYLIASADTYGFESEFTNPIFANVVDEMSRDILLITHSQVTTPNNFTFMDSVYSIYDRILCGYDYDIYVHLDSTNISICPTRSVACMDWHDFMKYKMIIIDDHLTESFFSRQYQDSTDGFVRYLAHGGKLAYFGRFRGYGFTNQYGTLLNYLAINHEFVNDFLGIDSIHIAGERYYFTYTSPPYIDTLFGFIEAVSTDSVLQAVQVDTLRDPFTPRLRNIWTPKTPPGVATFKLNENSTTAMLFKSVYPNQSNLHDHIVGVRRNFPELNSYAYTFGFHLWYMDSVEARNLIQSIFNDAPASLAAQSIISPTLYHVIEANALEPRFGNTYLGNLAQDRTVAEIVHSSILINNSVVPSSIQVLPFYEGFDGEVLQLEFHLREFIGTYLPVWDTLHTTFTINALLDDGLTTQATGEVIIVGHRRGDLNNDNQVNVLDLTILIDYLFRNGRLPEPMESADLDVSGSVNILDLIELIDMVFGGGNLN